MQTRTLSISLSAIVLFSSLLTMAFAGGQIKPTEIPDISSGAYFATRMLDPEFRKSVQAPYRFIENPNHVLVSALSTSFDAIDFDINANLNDGYYMIPPDPNGAAGPNYLVDVVNASIEIYDKSGVLQNRQKLQDFFTSQNPTTHTFDPKVIYDQYEDRFVVITLEKEDNGANDPNNKSVIYIAVSATADPTGSWYFGTINGKFIIDSNDYWTDYPGLAVDDKAIYITGNLFPFGGGSYGGSRLWIVEKGAGSGGFYDGGVLSVDDYDPAGEVGESATTMQPAHMFGTPPDNMGTFLVRYSGYSDGTNEFLSIIRVDNPLNNPTFTHQFVNVNDIDNTDAGVPDAPQLGTTYVIDSGDRRTLQAVWRNNRLYTVATLVPGSGSDAGQATAHWWQVNTSNLSSLTLEDQGNIGGEEIAGETYTFYPSIAVSDNGNIAIGFAASGASIYPGAYYCGRSTTDPAGTMQTSRVLREGLDYYYRAFGGSRNRWGDYSSISLDPGGNNTFWVFNEYASTRGSILDQYPDEDGRWATAFGNFTVDTKPNSPTNLTITDSVEVITMIWSDLDSTGKYRIYRSNDGNSFSLIDSTQNFSYTDSTVTVGQQYWYYVTAFNGVLESDPSNTDSAMVVAGPLVTIDGQFTEDAYYLLTKRDSTQNGFGGTVDLTRIYYASDDNNFYLGVECYVQNDSNDYNPTADGIGFFLNFSTENGASAGTSLGYYDEEEYHYINGYTEIDPQYPYTDYKADFEVDYMFAIYSNSTPESLLVDAATFVAGKPLSYQHIGITDQNGQSKIGPKVDGVFSAQALEFAFKPSSGDSSLLGFEIKIPFAEFNGSPTTRFQMFAFGVSSTAYFSDITIPGNIKSGNPGFNADFNTIDGGPFHTNWQYINMPSQVFSSNIQKASQFRLLGNYPNPFNPTTTIKYELAQSGLVRLVLYNLLGQKIRTLISKIQAPGQHQVNWDGKDELGKPVASGVYVYQLQVKTKSGKIFRKVRKMILMK